MLIFHPTKDILLQILHKLKANFITSKIIGLLRNYWQRPISLQTFLRKLQEDSHNPASHLLHSLKTKVNYSMNTYCSICISFKHYYYIQISTISDKASPTFPPCRAQTRPSSQWRFCVCVVPCIGVTALLCEG